LFTTSSCYGFTDDPLIAGVTPIRAVHVTELRSRIDVLRVRYGLPAYAFTNPSIVPGTSVLRAEDILELRMALSQAYAAAGFTPPTFSTTPAVGAAVRIADIADLRSNIVTLEQAIHGGS
jgi:hypothetical protein